MRLRTFPLPEVRLGEAAAPNYLLVLDGVESDRLHEELGKQLAEVRIEGCAGFLAFQQEIELG